MIPSLPGYGFSGQPTEIGWNPGRVARAWAELMRRLGYTRFVAQGGDVGAAVTDAMGRQAPQGLLGIHLNLLVTALAAMPPGESEPERAASQALATFNSSGRGYLVEQATRPQTIGYLLDSPVALAAWMLDHDTDSYLKISRAPRSWVEKSYRTLTYFHEVDRGGHFAAWEEPELFSTEVRAAFRSLR